jgi:hypothetical protein
MKNQLPPNWVVKNDGSQRFKDTVVKYMNDNFNANLEGSMINVFYGWQNNKPVNTSEERVLPDTVILTLDQFIEMTEWRPKVGERVGIFLSNGKVVDRIYCFTHNDIHFVTMAMDEDVFGLNETLRVMPVNKIQRLSEPIEIKTDLNTDDVRVLVNGESFKLIKDESK